MHPTTKLATTGAAAVLGLSALVGTAAAAAPAGPAGAAGPAGPVTVAAAPATVAAAPTRPAGGDRLSGRLEQACDRIPKALRRGAALQERLAADASTRGSLARLRQRLEAAESSGRPQRAALLTRRLEVREELQGRLRERTERLTKLQQGLCARVHPKVAAR